MAEHCKERYQEADSNSQLTWCCTHLMIFTVLRGCFPLDPQWSRAIVEPQFPWVFPRLWLWCKLQSIRLHIPRTTICLSLTRILLRISWTLIASGRGDWNFPWQEINLLGCSSTLRPTSHRVAKSYALHWRDPLGIEDSWCLLSAFNTDNTSSLTKACHRFYAKSIVSLFF